MARYVLESAHIRAEFDGHFMKKIQCSYKGIQMSGFCQNISKRYPKKDQKKTRKRPEKDQRPLTKKKNMNMYLYMSYFGIKYK